MAIKSVQLKNFLIFKDELSIDFEDGINVIIGENGVGKTTILKVIYSAFYRYFSGIVNDSEKECFIPYDDEKQISSYRNATTEISVIGNTQNTEAVFIPTTEMLSHSKGLLALNQKYKLPFDDTQIDIIVNASLPETREIPSNLEGILEKISKTIDGTVVMEDDTFYVVKSDGKKIEFSLEAEGLRKLGLIWKLIRNGLLEEGSVLLWDEPEANLNPELYPLVADILIELQKNGVQIFVATHSYNFAKYLEIRNESNKVFIYNIYKDENGKVCSKRSSRMDDLRDSKIMKADMELLDEIYKGLMGDLND
ncbi:MAG: AAA family ATPase [Ruminococcus flavefaciens]